MMATNKGPEEGTQKSASSPDTAGLPSQEATTPDLSTPDPSSNEMVDETKPVETTSSGTASGDTAPAKTTLAKAQKRQAARERMCIVTRQTSDEADLIRFVLDPSGVLIPDVKATLPGRGAWVSARRTVLAEAVKRKAFGRALKSEQAVLGLDDLAVRTEDILRHHARGSLAMARKAGLVTTGFSKVEGAIKLGKVKCLLHAVEAGSDGRMKLDRLAGHMDVSVMTLLTHGEMGLALGLEHVIHAALLKGPGASRFLAPLRRLELFCTDETTDRADGPANVSMKTGNQTGIGPGDKTAHE